MIRNVTDYLEKKLCEVYESENIFDKFDMQISPDSSMVLTGAYNGNAHVIDMKNQTNCQIDIKFLDKRGKNVGNYWAYKGKKVIPQAQSSSTQTEKSEPSKIDMTQKIKMGAWHPQENTFAVAKFNSLFIYTEKRS